MNDNNPEKNRKKRISWLVLLVLISSMLFGAYLLLSGDSRENGGGFSTPEKTLRNFYRAYQNRNLSGLRICCSEKFRRAAFTESNTKHVIDMAINNGIRKSIINITKIEFNGRKAIIEFYLNKTSSTPGWGGVQKKRFTFVKENGKWKIDTMTQIKNEH